MAPTILPMSHASDDASDPETASPAIRDVPALRSLEWLKRGWQDLRTHAMLSIAYGLIFTLAGWMIMLVAAPRPYLLSAAVSGFMLVAPLLAAGMYEISRRAEDGLATSLEQSVQGWLRNRGAMAFFGLALALVAIAWERISAILFALFYTGDLRSGSSLLASVFNSGIDWGLVIAYMGIGALVAAVVFALSVITVPMLVDRNVDPISAMLTSFRAVRTNPMAMVVWAGLLAAMMVVAFATQLVGMIVLLPLVAHASWHAYRDLTQAS